MSETWNFRRERNLDETESKQTEELENKNISELEELPFPLEEDVSCSFKKGSTLTETLNNIREYKSKQEALEADYSSNNTEANTLIEAGSPETPVFDQDLLRKEFEAALAKEREINDMLKARIEELSLELEKGRDKKYTQEEFEQEAIKTFLLVKDVLLVEVKKTDPESAADLERTVNAVFSALTDYPTKPEEGEKDE